MAIDLNGKSMQQQRAANAALARVRALQEEYGRPTQEGGWTQEQHDAWDAAWREWRDLVYAVGYPSQGVSMYESEMALKKAAREADAAEGYVTA